MVAASSNPVRTLIVDTRAPPAPTLDLRDDSDTGLSIRDNVTSDSTPVITGTAEGFATIRVLVGDTVLGTTMADSSGNWNFTSPMLSDGTYTLRTRAIDAAGNTSGRSQPLHDYLDTAAPAPLSVSLAEDTGVSNSDGITKNGAVSITGTEAGALLVEY